jgi:hypothetical protein
MSAKHHGVGTLRGIEHVPCSPFQRKERFGRLFPNLPGLSLDQEILLKLANSMEEKSDKPSGDSPTIPAGFTFFGQFVDHDITLDTTSSLERQNDPEAIRNFRTPLLELDSVYGSGPEATPYLYDQEREGHLLTGNNDGNPEDLPRNKQGVALIGDPRNDENGILSQLQLGFLKFHNVVFELVEKGKLKCTRYFDDDFREAQRLVRWHYQWIVVNEFLPLIIDRKVLRRIWKGLHCYQWDTEPFIPVEFAVAAYRFGHSQVRSKYVVNDKSGKRDLFRPPASGLTAFEPVPPELVVDWKHFFEIGGSKPQASRKIDTLVAKELFQLPFIPPDGGRNSLPFRNLLRGESFALPSGEAVACALGVDPLSPRELGIRRFGIEQTPLWFYILKEAECNAEDKLGEVGGTIVGEVFVGMLKGDSQSYLRVAPCWKPCLPAKKKGDFTLADLLVLAGKAS